MTRSTRAVDHQPVSVLGELLIARGVPHDEARLLVAALRIAVRDAEGRRGARRAAARRFVATVLALAIWDQGLARDSADVEEQL